MAQRKVRALARPPKRNAIAGLDYFTVMADADAPVRRRKQATPQNDEPKTARRFHIPEDEIDQYATLHAAGDSFPNPHRSGWYHFIIEGLKALGLDERHEWPDFHAKVQQLMSDPTTKDDQGRTLWERSVDQDADEGNARLLQNVEVLQRHNGMSPYGLRIHQIGQRVLRRRGACIDLEVWGNKLFIRLNLQPETIQVPIGGARMARVPVPINETRRLTTHAPQPEAPAAQD